MTIRPPPSRSPPFHHPFLGVPSSSWCRTVPWQAEFSLSRSLLSPSSSLSLTLDSSMPGSDACVTRLGHRPRPYQIAVHIQCSIFLAASANVILKFNFATDASTSTPTPTHTPHCLVAHHTPSRTRMRLIRAPQHPDLATWWTAVGTHSVSQNVGRLCGFCGGYAVLCCCSTPCPLCAADRSRRAVWREWIAVG